jgi:hypothetical protein
LFRSTYGSSSSHTNTLTGTLNHTPDVPWEPEISQRSSCVRGGILYWHSCLSANQKESQIVHKSSWPHLKLWGWQAPLDGWRWWQHWGHSVANMLLLKRTSIGCMSRLLGLSTSLE